jgi:hypothetical protein
MLVARGTVEWTHTASVGMTGAVGLSSPAPTRERSTKFAGAANVVATISGSPRLGAPKEIAFPQMLR